MFATQPICNAERVVHTLRSDQNCVNSGHYVCLAACLKCGFGLVLGPRQPIYMSVFRLTKDILDPPRKSNNIQRNFKNSPTILLTKNTIYNKKNI
jgi:hypothetical protein